MKQIIIIALTLPASYLMISVLYQFILAIAANLNPKPKGNTHRTFKKFLVLIPTYGEDEVILDSVKKNMDLCFQYPRTKFDLVVIGDTLKRETLRQIKSIGAEVIEVSFDKSTKVKALKAAMQNYKDEYDSVVILDSDNLMRWDFLHKMNNYLHNGYKVIQGQRSPFNNENALAQLDGISEIANHKMLCRGANKLGLSSKLSGSGMVFNFELFKNIIGSLSAIGGFDKELELLFTKSGQHIAYAEEAIVFDQKINSHEAYQTQRGRWLESQYTFFKKHWKPGIIEFFKGNRDYFHKVYQLAMPPRLIIPFALLLLGAVGLGLGDLLFTSICLIGLLLNILTYFMAVPRKVIMKSFGATIIALPRLLFSTIIAMTKMKASKVEFLRTPHHLAQSS